MQPAKWRSVSIDFPALADWDGTELERRFIGRDGRWSSTTRGIMAALHCDKLDLNLGWASVSQSWECPGCGRDKPWIARATSAGVVLARLEEHHDHLTDLINAGLRARLGQNWVERMAPGTGKLANYSEKLVRRFEPNFICHDCNSADGKAKNTLSELPRAFSFSPSEIGRFIRAEANREHHVDLAAARAVWREVRPQFERQQALAAMLVDQLATGALVQEPGANIPAGRPDPISLLGHLHSVVSANPALIGDLLGDLAAFERRSIARDGAASGNVRARPASFDRPTEADVAAHDGNGSRALWHGVAPTWTCEGCDRDRLALLRPGRSKARKWSARLHQHTEYVFDGTAAGDASVETHRNLTVCSDCFGILTGVKQRNADLAHDAAFLQIADMRALIEVEDNQPHIVDWEAAASRVQTNQRWRHAVESYHTRHREASSCRVTRDVAVRSLGETDGMKWLQAHYARTHPNWSETELARHIEILLADAERLPPL